MGGLLYTVSINPNPSDPEPTTLHHVIQRNFTNPRINKKTEKETSKTLETQTPVQQVSDPPMDDPKALEVQEPINVEEQGNQEEEEEEEGECGFCLFMKGGGCRDSFIAWEKCIEEAEKNKDDIVDKCFEVTGALKKCMEANSDYYAPILQAEKVVEEEAVRELEKEKAKESGSSSSSSSTSDAEERSTTKGSEQDDKNECS